jgi:hypothetical protein
VCRNQNNSKVELLKDSDVWIRHASLRHILFTAKTPAIMARGFFKELFTVEEIKEHSLNGRKCNADKTGQEALPPIDAKRKDAIFGKLQAHNYIAISINCISAYLLHYFRFRVKTFRT